MFGIRFEGHPQPVKLLLSEPFEGHPLRKDFPLMTPRGQAVAGCRRGRGGRGRVIDLAAGPSGHLRLRPVVVELLARAIVKTVGVLAFFLVVPLAVGYMEHKVLAHMQARLGPMEAGAFHGWAQLVADGVKFIQKEDVVPAAADRMVFSLAPGGRDDPVHRDPRRAAAVGSEIFALNLDVGIFFVMAIAGVGVIGVLMAGWASREQVLADRGAPGGRAADRLRASAGARRGGAS